MQNSLNHLLFLGVVISILLEDRLKKFYSNLYMLLKLNGGIHLILDPNSLYKYLQVPKLYMESPKVSYCLAETRGLSGIRRHPRCLSAYSCLPESVFYTFHSRRQTLPVCCATIWPILCSQSNYKGPFTFSYPQEFRSQIPRWPSEGCLSLQASTGPLRFFKLSVG